MLDCATLEPGRDPLTDLERLKKELEAYPVPEGQTPLLERQQIVALNKIDVPEARELAEFVKPDLEAMGYRVFLISTVSHEGLRQLTFALADVVERDRAAQEAEPVPERVVIKPRAVDRREFEIKVEGGTYGDTYRIIGAKPERWLQQTDFSNDEAVGYFADRLQKLGIDEALIAKGAKAGATVMIGHSGRVFDWEPTMTSAAEVQVGNRGTDPRFDENSRASRAERKRQYHERMDAKAAAREELQAERELGVWTDDEGFEVQRGEE